MNKEKQIKSLHVNEVLNDKCNIVCNKICNTIRFQQNFGNWTNLYKILSCPFMIIMKYQIHRMDTLR